MKKIQICILSAVSLLAASIAHANQVDIHCPLNPTKEDSDYEFEWIDHQNNSFSAKMKILPRDLGGYSYEFAAQRPISWTMEGEPVIAGFGYINLAEKTGGFFRMSCVYALKPGQSGMSSLLAMSTNLPEAFKNCKKTSKMIVSCDK